LYLSLAAVFVAQAAGVELTVGQQVTMLLTLMLTSKGVAGVPRASLVILAATLASYNLPLEGITLILGCRRADGHGPHDDQRHRQLPRLRCRRQVGRGIQAGGGQGGLRKGTCHISVAKKCGRFLFMVSPLVVSTTRSDP
jgi:hypothetical protein